MKKIQHPALREYVRRLNEALHLNLPLNTPDLTLVQVSEIEISLVRMIATDSASQIAAIERDLEKLKRMLGGRGLKSFDRLALKDYVANPDAWVQFLKGPASQLNSTKLSSQAQFWMGASQEVRAAIHKSAISLSKEDTKCLT